jgi:hypothetical protein
MIKLASKNQQLLFEERYRKEMLKPKFNVSGTLISSRHGLMTLYHRSMILIGRIIK